jgi:hypothetical protein
MGAPLSPMATGLMLFISVSPFISLFAHINAITLFPPVSSLSSP